MGLWMTLHNPRYISSSPQLFSKSIENSQHKLWWQLEPQEGDGVYRKTWNFKQENKNNMVNEHALEYDDEAFNTMDERNCDYNAPFSKALRVLKRVSLSTSAIGMAMGPMFLIWAESSNVCDFK